MNTKIGMAGWGRIAALVLLGASLRTAMAAPNGAEQGLLDAAKQGLGENVANLLGNGVNPEVQDRFGMTPLIYAAMIGRNDILRALMEHGAKVNTAGNGWTPLMMAAFYGKSDSVSLLLSRGAKANAVNNAGETVLMVAERSAWTEGTDIKTLIRSAESRQASALNRTSALLASR